MSANGNSYESHGDDSNAYARFWNEIMNSPYQTINVDFTAISPAESHTLAPGASFVPLSPPSSPPAVTWSLLAPGSGPSSAPGLPSAHSSLLGLEGVIPAPIQPVSPPYSASPPLSPVFVAESLSSPAAVQTEETLAMTPQSSSPVATSVASSGLVHNHPGTYDDYADGRRISNSMALSVMGTQIAYLNYQWTLVFLHCWHSVFHATHANQPVPNLVRIANRALGSAYTCWDAISPNDPLLPVPIVIDGKSVKAVRRTRNSAAREVSVFESEFKAIIRTARQANMNRLLQCTLGALVMSQVIPFLPSPYPDIRTQWTSPTMTMPRIYTSAQKMELSASVTWNPQFGCRIWHRFEGNRILWFANQSVRNFLAILLSSDENGAYTLGVRHARRNALDNVVSWAPVFELDNTSVLALLARLLASLSMSVIYDVVQQPSLTHSQFDSDPHRNSQINQLTVNIFRLLCILDDLSLEQHNFPGLDSAAREDGHIALLELKSSLGFVSV